MAVPDYYQVNLVIKALSPSSGLYYKHIMIVNDNSIVINKFVASLTDTAWVIIYDHHMFIVQATDSSTRLLSIELNLVIKALSPSSGMYYKHITIVYDNSSVIHKFEASLTDTAWVTIYYHHMFIVQATDGSTRLLSIEVT